LNSKLPDSISSHLVNKWHLVHASKDDTPFLDYHDGECSICEKTTKRKKIFKTPRAKFFHIQLYHDKDKPGKHTLSEHSGSDIPTLDEEIEKLKRISAKNQKRNFDLKKCLDSNPKTHRVTFDGGTAGVQEILLCEFCFTKSVFQKFVIKIEKVKN